MDERVVENGEDLKHASQLGVASLEDQPDGVTTTYLVKSHLSQCSVDELTALVAQPFSSQSMPSARDWLRPLSMGTFRFVGPWVASRQ